MVKRFSLNKIDLDLFREAMKGCKKLEQDTIVSGRQRPTSVYQKSSSVKKLAKQLESEFYFSDEYHPIINYEGGVHYIRPNVSRDELKKLRRGDYLPELYLDLHGRTQKQAKQDIAALIIEGLEQQFFCVSIMHGHGKHILKKQIPIWLAQHPDILAFHQAPKQVGGDAALLVLLDIQK